MSAPLVAVMGVSGSGKSTVGGALADRLEVPYGEGDDLHPAANVAKMRAGEPLDDHDRAPWLAAVGAWLRAHSDTGGVITCSALKRAYRDQLLDAAPRTVFVHLAEDRAELERRVRDRHDHYMPGKLLDSQLETLQPLQPGEPGLTLDGTRPVEQLVQEFVSWWGS